MEELDMLKEAIVHIVKETTDYETLDFVHKLLLHGSQHT